MSAIPTHIGKYEIVRRLGQGGMGSVYLARARDLDRFVAIKVLREQVFDEELLQRFFREARASANLRHDNIITIYDIGQHEHQPYMALEYVDGQTLFEIIRSQPALPLAEKLSYVEQICAGLHFAHGAGIVHRDIKPANVMVDARGVVRILDFGIARVEDSGMTRDGAMIGTLNYMSPEQMLGRAVDFRSDIFAVGTLAYELITYNKAFPGSFDDGLLQKLPYEDPAPLAQYCEGLPEALQGVLTRALVKRPDDRYASLEDMRGALREIRRDLDPALALETIVVAPRRGAKPSTAGKSTERPEFAERRARQIAVHLEAAREALVHHDIDSALAACEDALTLAPDNADAQALFEQVEQARRLRDDESRARRDRERSIRQRVADADLHLSRGDIENAAEALAQAVETDPANAAVRALVPKVVEAVRQAGLALPAVLTAVARELPDALHGAYPASRPHDARDMRPDPDVRSPGEGAIPPTVLVRPGRDAATVSQASSARPRSPLTLAVAAVAALAVGGVWMLSGDDASPPNQGPIVTTPPPDVPVGVPPTVVQPTPTVPAPEPEPTTTPPAPRAPETPADATLTQQIEAATSTYRSGDLQGALDSIEPLVDTTNDQRARRLAVTLAQDAMRAMSEAASAADRQSARDRAPTTYAAATRARERAERARNANRPVVAGRAALAAADAFRLAERESIAAAAVSAPAPVTQPRDVTAADAPKPAPAAAPPSAAAATPPSSTPETAPRAPTSAVIPPLANAPAAGGTTRPDPVEAERAGIRRGLSLYQAAYREKNLRLLLQIYPSIAREAQQGFDRSVKDCASVTVDFTNYRISFLEDDPSKGNVFVRSTYTCQPPTGQGKQGQPVEEIFQMEKVDGAWLIENMSLMDTRRRR